MKSILIKFIQFAIVGCFGMILDFGITYLLKEKLRVYKYLANSSGFLCAVCFNYLLNRYWTFESHNNIETEFFLFLLISLAGLVINNFILWLSHHDLNSNFYLAKLIATGFTVIWNFTCNYYMTFS